MDFEAMCQIAWDLGFDDDYHHDEGGTHKV